MGQPHFAAASKVHGFFPSLRIFFILLIFRIMSLGGKSRQVSGFKGVICKVALNKDLSLPSRNLLAY
jgi:hypothetical protein